jgi:hypothetical protein
MGRIQMELYADRLSRHAERLRDDIDGARMRIAWARFELAARARLGDAELAALEAVGALVGADEAAERRLLRRRLRQLQAVERLQSLVEEELSKASDASRPPSSS